MTPGAYLRLAAPLTVGPMSVRNRIVMAPMERNYGNPDGSPSERTIAHYARVAAGGVGWIDVESTFVDPVGRGRTHQLGLHDDGSIPGFRRLAEAAHAHDVRIGVELHHAGRNTSPALAGTAPVAPSAVECPEAGSGIPHELTREEIAAIVGRYSAAAARAAEAGLDAVELHSAHGYLPLAFLSPLTNLRTDEYGGPLENRMRFALEAIAAIRAAVPERIAVGCRFSAEELLPGGLTLDDTTRYAAALERAGVDYLSVSAGVYASFKAIIPPMDTPAGWLMPTAAAIREAVGVPVVGVSRFTAPADAEAALERGDVDLVAFGRAFLTDPEWPAKALSGRGDEQVSCIGCNQGCVSRIAIQLDVTCLVNPSCGRELGLVSRPASGRRTVLVVGAGPGGMEAARVAAERGHRVVLVDRGPEVGGRLRAAARLPHRPGWEVFIREGVARLERAGVELRLGLEADPALVAELAPDAVVLATGGAAVPSAGAVDAAALLDTGAGEVRRAVVLGSGPAALNVAEWLAGQGAEAVVVSDRPELSEDGQPGLLERVLATGRVTVRLDRELRASAAGEVTIVRTGAIGPLFEERLEAVDAIVETEALAPVPPPEWLAAAVPADRLHAVGDCRSPRSALEAIYEGALAGQAV
jgi:2,4-dienoyl-CoA reductase-like NADH-dependent reductase (Old Yellow Enzyme family)/thioredoxin reductase